MTYGLSADTIIKIQQVFAKYPQIESAILYGSRAKGNYTNGSDIDLTLKGSGLGLDILTRICQDLDELSTPYTFDISIFDDTANQELIEHIQRVGVVFYGAK